MATVGWLLGLRALVSLVSRALVVRLIAAFSRRWTFVGSLVFGVIGLGVLPVVDVVGAAGVADGALRTAERGHRLLQEVRLAGGEADAGPLRHQAPGHGQPDPAAGPCDDRDPPGEPGCGHAATRWVLTWNGVVSRAGVRPATRSVRIRLEPHAIVHPMWPWPVL